MTDPLIYYWSSSTQGTHKLAQKLKTPVARVGDFNTTGYYVIMTPSYGSPKVPHIPKAVRQFLNRNNKHAIGVIGTGNLNFGEDYCKAAHLIQEEYQIPILYRAELFGTEEDVQNIDQGIQKHWETLVHMKEG